MTLEFAKKEAQRRADVLGKQYAVVHSTIEPESYMVMEVARLTPVMHIASSIIGPSTN